MNEHIDEFVLDRTSSIPLYRQLSDGLREKIRSGEMQPGTKLPSVQKMMRTCSLSTATVQRALERLKAEGLVVGRRGRDVTVSVHKHIPPATGHAELWVETLGWLEGSREGEPNDRARFLNTFQSKYPSVRVEERAISNDLNWYEWSDVGQADADSLVDLTDMMLDEYGRSDQGSELFKLLQVDGRTPVMPLWLNAVVMACNLDVFERTGTPLPSPDWTWDEFLQTASRLKSEDVPHAGPASERRKPSSAKAQERAASHADTRIASPNGEGVYGFACGQRNWDSFLSIVWQTGGRVFSADGTRCLLNSSEAVEAGRIIRAVGGVCAPMEDFTMDDSLKLFLAGKVGMIMTGVWGYQYLNARRARWTAVPLPRAQERATIVSASGYGLAQRSLHQTVAKEFLREVARHELWSERRAPRLGIPLHRELELDGETERRFRDALTYGRLLLSDIAPTQRGEMHPVALDRCFGRQLRKLLFGTEPAKAVMEEVAGEVEYLITGRTTGPA